MQNNSSIHDGCFNKFDEALNSEITTITRNVLILNNIIFCITFTHRFSITEIQLIFPYDSLPGSPCSCFPPAFLSLLPIIDPSIHFSFSFFFFSIKKSVFPISDHFDESSGSKSNLFSFFHNLLSSLLLPLFQTNETLSFFFSFF